MSTDTSSDEGTEGGAAEKKSRNPYGFRYVLALIFWGTTCAVLTQYIPVPDFTSFFWFATDLLFWLTLYGVGTVLVVVAVRLLEQRWLKKHSSGAVKCED